MAKEQEGKGFLGASEGARRATGEAPKNRDAGGGGDGIPLRWSRNQKKAVVLRMFAGEPLAALSRELGVPIYRLEQWREKALKGIEDGLIERSRPENQDLLEARRKIGEITMENELLKKNLKSRGRK